MECPLTIIPHHHHIPLIGALHSYLITICPSNYRYTTMSPHYLLSLFGAPPPTIVIPLCHHTTSCLCLEPLLQLSFLPPYHQLSLFGAPPPTIVPTTIPPVVSIWSPSSNYRSYQQTTSCLYLEPLLQLSLLATTRPPVVSIWSLSSNYRSYHHLITSCPSCGPLI